MELQKIIKQTVGWLSAAIIMVAILVILYSSVGAQSGRRWTFSNGKANVGLSDDYKIVVSPKTGNTNYRDRSIFSQIRKLQGVRT